jgi:hypothetical protein
VRLPLDPRRCVCAALIGAAYACSLQRCPQRTWLYAERDATAPREASDGSVRSFTVQKEVNLAGPPHEIRATAGLVSLAGIFIRLFFPT